MAKVTDLVAQLAQPLAEAAGCSLWDVEYVKEAGTWYLRIYIDKETGVSIDDCEAVSRPLSDALDEADPIEGSYTLEVSSAGADRVLKKPEHFQRFCGEEVEVRLYRPKDGKKDFVGLNSFVRTPYETIKDELFLKELVDSLAMSGIANEIAGSSAPTSGSEHLISHALDKISEVPQLHGIQVGIATYIMSKVQDHRYVRVETVLRATGFFDYAATLGMKREDFIKAIEMAPSIKPFRHTYLHEETYRELAKKIVLEDEVLQKVLV